MSIINWNKKKKGEHLNLATKEIAWVYVRERERERTMAVRYIEKDCDDDRKQ